MQGNSNNVSLNVISKIFIDKPNSYTALTAKPADWDTNWMKYFSVDYDPVSIEPSYFDPTHYFKYVGGLYVAGSSSDTWGSNIWYAKRYIPLTSQAAPTFVTNMYYSGSLEHLVDSENSCTSFGKVEETIEHVRALDDTTVRKSEFNIKMGHLEQLLAGMTVSRLIDFENNSTDILVGDLSRLKVYSKIGRCNLNDAGEVTAWYGEQAYSETGSNGQVMVRIPKFYYRVEPLKLTDIGTGGLGGYHLKRAIYSISDFPMAGYKLHPAFVNESGHEIDEFFIGAFEACTYDVSENAYNITDNGLVSYIKDTGDLLASIGCTVAGDLTSGAKPTSGLSQTTATRPNFEIIANNRGPGWHSCLIKQISAIQMLMLVEGGMVSQTSTHAICNTQVNFGRGVVDITDNTSYNCSSLTGSTVGNVTGNAAQTYNEIGGTKTSYTVNGKVSTSWRGVENLYGNIWAFVWGMNIWGDGNMRGGAPYICNDFNFAEGIHEGDYQHPGFTAINTSGYISSFGYNKEDFDWLLVGSDTSGGGENKMIGDYNYTTSNLNGYRIARLGGHWNVGGWAGAFYWNLNDGVGYRSRAIGSRVMYIPQT